MCKLYAKIQYTKINIFHVIDNGEWNILKVQFEITSKYYAYKEYIQIKYLMTFQIEL